jgi:hypothetical protein
MENKIIISGCSASKAGSDNNPSINWVTYLDKKCNYNIKQMAIAGQSNESITKKIYDFITQNNSKDCIFVCQLTYTHRIGWYHQNAKMWIDYQPNFINPIPEFDEETDKIHFPYTYEKLPKNSDWLFPNKNVTETEYEELTKMYRTWLTYVYDEDEMFKQLMYKVDLLNAFVEKTNNKIFFIYWPNTNNDFEYNELQKRNFFNVENQYSILKWSTKNKLVCKTTHLSDDGQVIFSELIDKKLKEYKNISKYINIDNVLSEKEIKKLFMKKLL